MVGLAALGLGNDKNRCNPTRPSDLKGFCQGAPPLSLLQAKTFRSTPSPASLRRQASIQIPNHPPQHFPLRYVGKSPFVFPCARKPTQTRKRVI